MFTSPTNEAETDEFRAYDVLEKCGGWKQFTRANVTFRKAGDKLSILNKRAGLKRGDYNESNKEFQNVRFSKSIFALYGRKIDVLSKILFF